MSCVLGIESSCDDTAVAVVRGGREVLAETTATQAIHDQFGGVVPELASRDHLRRVWPAVDAVLRQSGVELGDLDAVAVTCGPGLVGSLLVGVSFARGLALSTGLPTIAVHHLEAHLLVHRLHEPDLPWPFLALLVSGGHTELIRANGVGQYRVLGETRDDAAGEAFDKVGKLLGLGYPAGPTVDRLSAAGNPAAVSFPRARLGRQSLDFSFSGLKTAVSVHAERHPVGEDALPDVLASFQEAVVDVLVEKTLLAADHEGLDSVVLAGGVAANSRLRSRLGDALEAVGRRLILSPPALCTDNGVMVAVAGTLLGEAGLARPAENAHPVLPL